MTRKESKKPAEKKLFVSYSQRYKVNHFIREWRKHRGLTQQELAKRTDYTDGAISHIETGQTAYSQTFLEAIAKALDCEPADLIQHEPQAATGKRKISELIAPLDADDTETLLVMVEAFVAQRRKNSS